MHKLFLMAAVMFSLPAFADTAGEVVLKGRGGQKAFCAVESLEQVSIHGLNPAVGPNGSAMLFIDCKNTVKTGLQEQWAEAVRSHVGVTD